MRVVLDQEGLVAALVEMALAERAETVVVRLCVTLGQAADEACLSLGVQCNAMPPKFAFLVFRALQLAVTRRR